MLLLLSLERDQFLHLDQIKFPSPECLVEIGPVFLEEIKIQQQTKDNC